MLEVRRATQGGGGVREPRANERRQGEADRDEKPARRGDERPEVGGANGEHDGGEAEHRENAPDPDPRRGDLHA